MLPPVLPPERLPEALARVGALLRDLGKSREACVWLCVQDLSFPHLWDKGVGRSLDALPFASPASGSGACKWKTSRWQLWAGTARRTPREGSHRERQDTQGLAFRVPRARAGPCRHLGAPHTLDRGGRLFLAPRPRRRAPREAATAPPLLWRGTNG